MQITVQRQPANRQGPDIVDELLASDPPGIARGRAFIDKNCSNRDLVACQCPAHAYMPTGSLVNVTETRRRWRGMIRYWSLTLTIDETGDSFTADTRLTIEKVEG
jgi:hypothetical protein